MQNKLSTILLHREIFEKLSAKFLMTSGLIWVFCCAQDTFLWGGNRCKTAKKMSVKFRNCHIASVKEENTRTQVSANSGNTPEISKMHIQLI